MDMQAEKCDCLKMAVEIVVAFLLRNPTKLDQVADLMKSVHANILEIAGQEARFTEREAHIVQREARLAEREAQPSKPAVPVAESVMSDWLICLECGREQKSLKMHLERAHDLTTQSYRAKWALPFDYPMVAPNLSARRSALAYEVKLGQRRTGRRFRASK